MNPDEIIRLSTAEIREKQRRMDAEQRRFVGEVYRARKEGYRDGYRAGYEDAMSRARGRNVR